MITFQKITNQNPLYTEMLLLRKHVLLDPLGFSSNFEEIRQKEADHIFWIALLNTRLIGCAIYAQRNGLPYIRQVVVSPEYQKQGIGKQLVQVIEQEAQRHNQKKLYLYAHKDVYPFYVKLGYEATGPWMKQQNGLETIEMKKELN